MSLDFVVSSPVDHEGGGENASTSFSAGPPLSLLEKSVAWSVSDSNGGGAGSPNEAGTGYAVGLTAKASGKIHVAQSVLEAW
eukprot:CAMPEP_0171795024 /NCGR_PEP_ID=MMETSP0991-20121206/68483_1 /TAXON_ID=483369 /ORGANISM="non described non described, Strain CCMP2098" /LENGTH=81 /DNA_ID=CAMNT_0012405555 /DNA_START=380 /DNA_END=622 /DNA_ORIENTATION=+